MTNEWTGKCWRRKLNKWNGTPEDRAAEAGHRILAAGFPIRIYDQELRARAIAGEYEPECTRWVQARTSGKYEGWFAINWDRREEKVITCIYCGMIFENQYYRKEGRGCSNSRS